MLLMYVASQPQQAQNPKISLKKEMRSLHQVIALCCAVVVLGALPFSSDAQLDPSFYNKTCSNVHSIVRDVIRNVSKSDPRMLASLIRLHFHDCFVQVCCLRSSSLYLKFGVNPFFSIHFKANSLFTSSITFF